MVVEKKTPPRPSPAPQEREPPPFPKKQNPIRREPAPEPPEPEPVVLAEHQTQIQFSTPGGTRVIWVLHPVTE